MHVLAEGMYMHDVQVPIAGVITSHDGITGIFMSKLLKPNTATVELLTMKISNSRP